jgi:hypothetical protein
MLNFHKYTKQFSKYFINKNQKRFFNVNVPSSTQKKTYGGLKDQDRIFTNLYRDGDPFIEGALKRVFYI